MNALNPIFDCSWDDVDKQRGTASQSERAYSNGSDDSIINKLHLMEQEAKKKNAHKKEKLPCYL
jgi:hypothetical protein